MIEKIAQQKCHCKGNCVFILKFTNKIKKEVIVKLYFKMCILNIEIIYKFALIELSSNEF